MNRVLVIAVLTLLAGCAAGPEGSKPQPEEPPAAEAAAMPAPTARVTPMARTAEEFDTTSAAERAKALRPAAGGVELGVTIASLGAVGEPGFWLKTPLVSAPVPGRALNLENGKSVNLELIPIGGTPGAGSRISLAALRAIEAPLTGLPELRVFSLAP